MEFCENDTQNQYGRVDSKIGDLLIFCVLIFVGLRPKEHQEEELEKELFFKLKKQLPRAYKS